MSLEEHFAWKLYYFHFTSIFNCVKITTAVITYKRGTRMLNSPACTQQHYIYIVLSETPTKFGSAIRRLGKIKYNHASIAFDEKLHHLFSFGRRQYKNPMNAGLIKEHPERFTLRKYTNVNVRIYKVPVTEEQYKTGKKRILEIMTDPDGYLYNLFSVLLYPILRDGFPTYKAYTCAEFVAHMIRRMGIELDACKLDCEFTPEAIGVHIENHLHFEGNLLDYCDERPYRTGFFFDQPKKIQTAKTSCSLPLILVYRKLRYRNKYAAAV